MQLFYGELESTEHRSAFTHNSQSPIRRVCHFLIFTTFHLVSHFQNVHKPISNAVFQVFFFHRNFIELIVSICSVGNVELKGKSERLLLAWCNYGRILLYFSWKMFQYFFSLSINAIKCDWWFDERTRTTRDVNIEKLENFEMKTKRSFQTASKHRPDCWELSATVILQFHFRRTEPKIEFSIWYCTSKTLFLPFLLLWNNSLELSIFFCCPINI